MGRFARRLRTACKRLGVARAVNSAPRMKALLLLSILAACGGDNEDDTDGYLNGEMCGDGIVQTGEVCDDGNGAEGDGCKTDCTYSCDADADCAPDNACSTAVCADHACVAGAAIECADDDACTADACNVTSGCVHSKLDIDQDGFGPGEPCGGDCNDGSAAVRPGQTAWFAVKIAGAPAASDFDYDCDGVETKRITQLSTCENFHTAFHCNMGATNGWYETVPACGATAEFGIDCAWTGTECGTIRQMHTQECR
jgi:cysteine-rich repeat protein